jgi:hypothetical protein
MTTKLGAFEMNGRKFGGSSTESEARERVIGGDREAGVRAGELPTGGPVPGDRTNVAVRQGQDEDDQGEGKSAGAGDERRRHGQVYETCRLTAGEGSGRFITAAPISKGELLRAKSGTGGLSSLSGDGERSIMAGTSSMGPSMGAGGNIGARGLGAG